MPEQADEEEPVKKTAIVITREEELEGACPYKWTRAMLTSGYSNSRTIRGGAINSHIQLGAWANRGMSPAESLVTRLTTVESKYTLGLQPGGQFSTERRRPTRKMEDLRINPESLHQGKYKLPCYHSESDGLIPS